MADVTGSYLASATHNRGGGNSCVACQDSIRDGQKK